MLRHINCISGEENYASGGVISEDEEALELKCTHVSTQAWPIPSRVQLEVGASPALSRLRWKEPISLLRVN